MALAKALAEQPKLPEEFVLERMVKGEDIRNLSSSICVLQQALPSVTHITQYKKTN